MLFAMDDAADESEKITIRCPNCTQRFKVTHDFMGRMVECGGCDGRFRVSESVVVRVKKFYPGENRDPALERFSRIPMKSGPMPKFQAAPMVSDVDVQREVQTFSPLRLLLGIVAVALIVGVGLLMVLGGEPGRVLDGAPFSKRMLLAGFTGLLASVLLVAANPFAKSKAILGGLVGLGTLLALPFFFKSGLPDETRDPALVTSGNTPVEPEVVDPLAAMKDEMTYSKLEEAISNYGPSGQKDGVTAVGVWLRDVREYNKDLIVKYLIRVTGAGPKSWAYSRPPADYLVVLHDVNPDVKAIARFCERFGKLGRVVDELQVVEVSVDNQRFVGGPLEKLSDPEDPAFYDLNRRELESIDPDRVAQAVNRLAGASPDQHRKDIASRFRELLETGDTKLRSHLSRALAVWGQEGDGSVEAVNKAAQDVARKGEPVPRPMIEYLVKAGDQSAIDFIHSLWVENPGDWEALYGDLGNAIEAPVIEALDEPSMLLKMSAIRLLGRVGGGKSLAKLRSVRDSGTTREVRAQVDQAISSIESRR